MIDTVIFDLDGTLLDTLEDLMVSTNYALEKNGYPPRTKAEVRRFVGNGIRKLITRALACDLAADGRTVIPRSQAMIRKPLTAMPESQNALPESSTVLPGSSTVLPESSTVLPEPSTVLSESLTKAPKLQNVLSGSSTVLSESLTEADEEKVYADFTVHYDRHCNDKTGPYPGIMELLRELKARGIRMGICSNKAASAVEQLNEIYFDGLIDVAAGVADGIPTKPDPAMAESVLARLGSRKENTLYVGDSQVDVATAANVGLRMIMALWGFRDRDELKVAGADNFIEEPSELLNFL